jgi:hypothetical protein
MAELKTKVNDASVTDFLNAIPDAQVREDCWKIAGIMEAAAKAKPRMWGPNIVGFGEHEYVYADGHKAAWMLTAFSPRKQNITLYIMDGFEKHDELMSQLGKHSCGKGCLYIKRLSDVDLPVLKKLVNASVRNRMRAKKG